ncbi:MAG: hypothetical protein MJZ03_06275 [archaeon]|nr:hypothetical protein [archaeon]
MINTTDREFLTYLQNIRDKQKEMYLKLSPGYEQAKEKGRYLGIERACFQFELEIINREREAIKC